MIENVQKMEESKVKVITHDIKLDASESTKYRNWGYSVELDLSSFESPDSCHFCNSTSFKYYKNICNCGLHDGFDFFTHNFGINAAWSPENGEYTFCCCEKCLEQMINLLQREDEVLCNHQILAKLIKRLKQAEGGFIQ